MIAIAIILGLVFILIICIIVYAYHKDIVELENRILQLEKRQTDEKKDLTWQIQWETKLRNDGEKEINKGLKDLLDRVGKLERKGKKSKNEE